jgi:F0F1-type ATP synthase assembly protein I
MFHPSSIRRIGQASALVSEMAVTVVFGVLAGHWIDGTFGSSPIFLTVCSIAALALGTVRLLRSLPRILPPDDPHDPPPAR